jgi:hypothetical protein
VGKTPVYAPGDSAKAAYTKELGASCGAEVVILRDKDTNKFMGVLVNGREYRTYEKARQYIYSLRRNRK